MSYDAFTTAYIACALWSSTDESDENGGDPIDQNYSAEDLDPETAKQMVEDCNDFQSTHKLLLDEAKAMRREVSPMIREYSDEQAGHDFWLTRNAHGAGFWDRGLGRSASS